MGWGGGEGRGRGLGVVTRLDALVSHLPSLGEHSTPRGLIRKSEGKQLKGRRAGLSQAVKGSPFTFGISQSINFHLLSAKITNKGGKTPLQEETQSRPRLQGALFCTRPAGSSSMIGKFPDISVCFYLLSPLNSRRVLLTSMRTSFWAALVTQHSLLPIITTTFFRLEMSFFFFILNITNICVYPHLRSFN